MNFEVISGIKFWRYYKSFHNKLLSDIVSFLYEQFQLSIITNRKFMSKNLHLAGKIVIQDKIVNGSIKFNDTISDINIENERNYSNYIVPGFVDLHCHGGNGYDSMEGIDSINQLSK